MLTVLIPTRNGANTLPMVLESYCRLESPPGGWKLVIIDNGSTDKTRSVVSAFQNRLPLTYLFEPAPGKNVALNLGLHYTEGDLVVFSDDDSVPRIDWLVQMRAASDANPSFCIFAGKVRPLWQKLPSDWIIKSVPLGPTFTVSDPDLPEGPTNAANVFGPNMAVRKEVFDSGHRFCVSIGPRGKSYPMGSETEFVRRMVRSGARCWYSPKAVVGHLIDAQHLDKSWILQRAILYGRGQYHMEYLQTPSQQYIRWFGVPRFIVRQLCEKVVQVVRAAIVLDKRQLLVCRWELNVLWGQVVEAHKVGIGSASVSNPR